MSFVCTFCGAPLPPSPPGVLVRCASCDGLTPSPGGASMAPTELAIPTTTPAMPAAPTQPFGPSIKGAASPPPANPGRSTAGGVDEIVGAGALIFGIFTVKTLVMFAISSLTLSCCLFASAMLLGH
jgi:hypothetical protein